MESSITIQLQQQKKAKEFGIKNFDTIKTNGLTKDWSKYKRIWINPPFTLKNEFLAKAVETYTKTFNEIYILFPTDYMTTKKFHEITKSVGGILYLPKGRINFERAGKSPSFGSVILKLNNKKDIVIKRIVI